MSGPRRIAFRRIANAALAHADVLVQRWLPDGRREGAEWIALNPPACQPPQRQLQNQPDHRPVV
jgi:hypothetical protein